MGTNLKDPAQAVIEATIEAAEDGIAPARLKDVKGILERNALKKERPLKKSLTMRNELERLGVTPSTLALEVMTTAMEAYKALAGSEHDPGPGYLGIAARMVELLAKYNYATMKAVQITVEDAKKAFDHTDPKQVMSAIIDDPFFSEEQRTWLMEELKRKGSPKDE